MPRSIGEKALINTINVLRFIVTRREKIHPRELCQGFGNFFYSSNFLGCPGCYFLA